MLLHAQTLTELSNSGITVPHKASNLARPGWSMHITAARLNDAWQLLEIGFVYHCATGSRELAAERLS